MEERLGGADGGLMGGDRLGQLAAELAAGQDPGGKGTGGEAGQEREENDDVHRANRASRPRCASTRRQRQNRVTRRSVTALARSRTPGAISDTGRLRDCNAHSRTGNGSRKPALGLEEPDRRVPVRFRTAARLPRLRTEWCEVCSSAGVPMVESSPVFADGFGRRVVRVGREDAPVELLQIDPALAEHPGFADALRERVAKLASLRLTSYARALRVETDAHGGVTLVSEYVKGWRLADLLDVAETENLIFDIGVVMLLLRQLLPTAAMLSNQSRDTASGALGPEHLLLTAQGRVVLTDYVLGPAIDTLGWTPERLWTTLRVATPPGTDGPWRLAACRRRPGWRHGALAGGRPALARRRVPRSARRAGRQRPPAHPDRGRRPAFGRTAQLAHPGAATGPTQLRDALRGPARARTAAGHRDALIAQPMELDGAMARLDRLMPAFELPTPPATPTAPPLLDMPAPNHDWVLPAVAFDKPAKPKAVPPPPEIVKTWQTSAAAVAEAPEPLATGAAAAADARAGARSRRPSRRLRAPAPAQHSDRAGGGSDGRVRSARVESSPESRLARVRFGEPPARRGRSRAPAGAAGRRPVVALRPAVAALAALVLLQGALIGWQLSRPSEGLSGDGELVVQSRPEGARVAVDNEDRGQTPLTLRLAPGTHVLQLRVGAGEPRVIPLQIHAGVQTAQYVEMQGVSTTGVLEVRSEPSRARVTIDGEARGSTPLTLRDVAPGDYQVVLERAGWKSTQMVRVEPGATAQLVVPIR